MLDKEVKNLISHQRAIRYGLNIGFRIPTTKLRDKNLQRLPIDKRFASLNFNTVLFVVFNTGSVKPFEEVIDILLRHDLRTELIVLLNAERALVVAV